VVYIPGTQSLDLWGKNPLNMRSNLTAFGGVSASPTQLAVSDALTQVKADESDSVLFVGHSQGALVAARLAITDQPYQVAGLVSLGGPIAQFDLQVPVIALQNQGDPVPHLGGQINPMQENWVTASNEREFDSVVDAHKVSSYVEFAKKLDANHDPGLIRIHEQITQMPNQSGLRYVFELSRD
jgi:pimeloyl-ACP methyl ester carboxylesterase